MARFKVELHHPGDLADQYPYEPKDVQASLGEYLSEMFDSGWQLVSTTSDGAGTRFYFVALASTAPVQIETPKPPALPPSSNP